MFAQWRAERAGQRRAAAYVAALMREPDSLDVEWLTEAATRGDTDHARWELRYARRAVGLLAAQRDALDDRTASDVARELALAAAQDANIARETLELSERQFNVRLSAYRDGLEARGGAPTPVRMGQTLLAFAGGAFRDVDDGVQRAGAIVTGYLTEASAKLREIYGAASLPEDVPPSMLEVRR